MSWWDRFYGLTASGPTGGAVSVILLSIVALAALTALRRMRNDDSSRDGRAPLVSLWLALVLGVLRLGLVQLGLGEFVVSRAIGVMATVLLSLGMVGTLLLLAFDVVPGRLLRRRAPPILHEIVMMIAFVVIVIGALGEIQEAKKFTAVMTTSAVLTAVIGLALQSTLSNLFAGLALQMDHALGVGDWVRVSGHTGRILEIRWRSTLLRTLDGDIALVPNSKLLADDLLNHSRPSPTHRCSVQVTFHYRHAPNEVRGMVIDAVSGTPGVLAAPQPDCFPLEFGAQGVVYIVRFWVDDFVKVDPTSGEVRARIWYAARRAGLEIPLPIRMLHVQQDDATTRGAAERADRKQRLEVLDDVALFASLDRADRELLADGMRRVRFARGEVILEQGDGGSSLYVIVTGAVRVSLAHGGASRVVATLGPGDCFGEMSLLTGEPRAATCVAESDVDCFELGHDALRRMLTASPHLADELATQLASRQKNLSAQGAQLSAEAARKVGPEVPLLSRVRSFFGLG